MSTITYEYKFCLFIKFIRYISHYLLPPMQSAATQVPSGTQEPNGEVEAQAEWKQKGRIHSKKSMKVNLVGGKRYLWCACGYSKNQVSAFSIM